MEAKSVCRIIYITLHYITLHYITLFPQQKSLHLGVYKSLHLGVYPLTGLLSGLHTEGGISSLEALIFNYLGLVSP